MVQVVRLLVSKCCNHLDCRIHLTRYLTRNLVTLASLLSLLILVLYTWQWHVLLPASLRETLPGIRPEPHRHCNLLDSVTRGTWVPRAYRKEEMDSLREFISVARSQWGLPTSLERPDGRCGNETFDHLTSKWHKLLWFRALCNPGGPRPCCYHNRCSNVGVADCRCSDCYDLRQRIHAEFADWMPSDPACKVKYFHNKTDTCELLTNTTVLMIGDSFMRHVYIALLSLMGRDMAYGPTHKHTTEVTPKECRGDFIHLHRCRIYVDNDTSHCRNTTRLKFLEYIAAHQTHEIRKAINELRGIPNSYVLLGIGIHDDFYFKNVATKLLDPLLQMIKTFRWPEVIWLSMHAPGLLKTPRVPAQGAANILLYNKNVKRLIQTNSTWVPILDFYQLTREAVSYDGAHYGRGVNGVKAQIFLNYILERHRDRKRGLSGDM